MTKKSFIELDTMTTKEKLAIGTAITAFILGWCLTVAGFIVPPLGEIGDGVLWVLGQALLYSASVFGITGYFQTSTKRMKMEIRDFVKSGDESILELDEDE